MTEIIRLLLVDDQRLMRDGLRILLELESDFEVIGEAEDGAQAGLLPGDPLQKAFQVEGVEFGVHVSPESAVRSRRPASSAASPGRRSDRTASWRR